MMQELQDLLASIGMESTKFYTDGRLPKLIKIAQELDLHSWEQPIISVTGTNGKGSTVRAIASIYQAAGYRTGIFTSPHLYRVNERIAINETMISDEALYQSLTHVLNRASGSEFSFFELITLAALDYFKRQGVDVLILEVGLGGRLDAINILDANLVVMTSIDFDHQHILGPTLEDIAREKAGLLRPQATLVFADRAFPPSLMVQVQALNLKLLGLGRGYDIDLQGDGWTLSYEDKNLHFDSRPKLDIQAMAAAMMVTLELKMFLPFEVSALQQANFEARIPARLQRLEGNPPIILDVAHNPHAVRRLYDYLLEQNIAGKIHLVFSVLQDKDGPEIVKIINKLSPLWYTCLLPSERAHGEESLLALFADSLPQPFFHASPIEAFKAAGLNADKDDLIVVFGSFLLVAQIGQYLKQEGVYGV